MGSFRFYRRKEIFPGVKVNLSKSGPSVTFGAAGLHLTVGPHGVRKTVGIPGTGFYYTSTSGYHTGVHSAHREPEEPGLKLRHVVLAWLALCIGLLIAGQPQLSAYVTVYGFAAILLGWPLYRCLRRFLLQRVTRDR